MKPGEIELNDGTAVRNRKGLFAEDNFEAVRGGKGSYDRTGGIFTRRV